jgi:hypothetical protein
VVAKALGMSTADLKTALAKGQSIADVAKAKNVDVQKVVDALTQDANSRVDAAVKAGKITQARADAMKQDLASRISAFVDRTFPGRSPWSRRGPGFRGSGGGSARPALAA